MIRTSRRFYLEIIRVIALVCIVYNHTGPRGNNAYLFTESRITFVVSLISDILCRIGVPLFLMISGALLLNKEESWQETYRKRVIRIVEVIVVFTGIRYLYECFWVKTMTFSIIGIVKVILCGNLFLPYWFLYTYLSILLILPFLRKMIKNLTEKELKLLVILILGFYVLLPVVSLFINWEFELSFMIGLNCCYLFLGYYLEHGMNKMLYNRKNIISALIIIFVSVAVSYWFVVKNQLKDGIIHSADTTIFTMVLAVNIFFVVKALFIKYEKDGILKKCITTIGSCSFGMYLIEDYLRNGLSIIFDNLEPQISTIPACVIWLTVVLVVGVAVVIILKKIPILKDIL